MVWVVFFCDNVPFSYSTGLEFAADLAELIIEVSKEVPDQSVYVSEWGAGLGFLSKHIADVLYKKCPDTALKMKLKVTDNSAEIVRQIEEIGHFKAYENQLSFEVMDVSSPKLSTPAHVVVMAYVLDSLSTRHIEIEDGAVYEIQVQSTINTESPFCDTTQCPPVLLSARELKEVMGGPFDDKKRVLISRLSEAIVETYRRVEISDSGIQENESVELVKFIRYLNNKGPMRFNFSYEGLHCLQVLLSSDNAPHLVCIYDVGMTEQPEIKEAVELTGQYGATQFYPVFLPLIRYVGEQYGYTVYTSSHPQEKGQLTILYKGINGAGIAKAFAQTQVKEGGEAGKQAGELLKTLDEDLSSFTKQASAVISNLYEYERVSHTLLMNLAIEYKKRGGFNEALVYAKDVIHLYGKTAISAWHLLGEIYYHQGHYERALNALDCAITQAPDYMGSYHVAGLVFAKLKQNDNVRKASLCTLERATSTYKIAWSQLLTVALMDLTLKQRPESKAVLNWIMKTSEIYPALFPYGYADKAKNVYDAFFRFGVQNAPKLR